MPIDAQIRDDGGRVIVGHGTITGSEVISATNRFYETDDMVRSIRYQLADFRSIENVEFSGEQVKELVERDLATLEINPHIVTAAVSDSKVVFGITRLWQIYTEVQSPNTAAFQNLDDAEAWIARRLAEIEGGQS